VIFTDYNPTPKKLKYDSSNKLLDLSTTAEDHIDVSYFFFVHGTSVLLTNIKTGNTPDVTMRPGSVRAALPLIRRLNRHSTVVLKPARYDHEYMNIIEI
jgi:hypothetical protein